MTRQIVVAGSFATDPIELPLQFWIETLNAPLTLHLAPYGQVMQQLLDPGSAFHANARGINVLLLRLEDSVRDLRYGSLVECAGHLERTASEWAEGIAKLSASTGTSLFVFFAPPSPARTVTELDLLAGLGNRLAEQLSEIPGVYTLQHAAVMEKYPVEDHDDPVGDRLAHVPYTNEYYAAVATALMRRVMRLLSPPHKVFVVDCDNTLWKGICGEQAPADLELTADCEELQRMLVRHQEAGTLLCLCSKNSLADVEAVFEQRRDMPLRLDHIVSHRVNWTEKSQNIVSLAGELNLGTDSFIFIDDSPVECAEVRARCPEVLTLQVPPDSGSHSAFLKHTWVFDPPARIAGATERNARYKENQAREAMRASTTDLRDFIAQLRVDVRVAAMEPEHVERVAELVVRTNQFNLTTVRRSPGEVAALARTENMHAQVVHVRDRFGDYGLTGVIFLRVEGAIAIVDTFLLSCRVLGRGVEVAIVNQLGRWAADRGLDFLRFDYRRTLRNTPARDFVQRAFAPFEVSVAEGATYPVPTSYAVQLTIEHQSSEDTEQTARAPAPVDPSAQNRLEWHGRTQVWSRISDLTREIERRYTARRRSGARRVLHEPPRGTVEESLAEIWSELLAADTVSRNDGFLELGGNSLLAVRLIARVEQRFAVHLSIGTILRCRSLAEMAQLIEAISLQPVVAGEMELEEGAV